MRCILWSKFGTCGDPAADGPALKSMNAADDHLASRGYGHYGAVDFATAPGRRLRLMLIWGRSLFTEVEPGTAVGPKIKAYLRRYAVSPGTFFVIPMVGAWYSTDQPGLDETDYVSDLEKLPGWWRV